MPCIEILRAIDPAPEVYVREAYGASFVMRVAVDIQCKKHANSTEFSQVFTLESNPVNLTSTLNITEDFKLVFEVDDFAITFDNVTDSNVGNITVGVLNTISKGLSKTMVSFIDALGKKGLPLQPIFNLLHLKWLDAHDTRI